MRSAADLEDSTEKSTVTPGPVLPARELMADLLMEVDHPQQAFQEYSSLAEDGAASLSRGAGCAPRRRGRGKA